MRLKVPPSGWLQGLLQSFGIIYERGYQPELDERLVPVYVTNPTQTVNNVSVFADAYADQQLAFIGASSEVAAAGQFSWVQLHNPVGSGVNVYLDHIITGHTTNDGILIRSHNADLGGGLGGSVNKYLSGAAAKALIKHNTNVALQGTTTIAVRRHPADTSMETAVVPPIKLPPGFGVLVEAGVANAYVEATFQWREVAI